MFAMLGNIINDINVFIQSWDSVTFALVVILAVMFLFLATRSFVKKAISDKPAIKIGKILLMALLVFVLVYVISVH